MGKTILLLGILLFLSGCTGADRATSILTQSGYTDIQIHGNTLFGCGRDDKLGIDFTAKNPRGDTVTGTVCDGWLKGGTIRF